MKLGFKQENFKFFTKLNLTYCLMNLNKNNSKKVAL